MILAVLALTLQVGDVVDEALARSPLLAASDANTHAAAARLDETRSSRWPRADASVTWMRSDNPVFVFGSLLEQGRFGAQHFDPAFLNDPGPLTNVRAGVNIRYTLFDQLRRMHDTAQARNAVAQAGFGGDETRQQIRLEALSRAWGLVLAERTRAVAVNAVQSAEADAEAMRARYEEGLLVESDLRSAEVHLAAMRQRVVDAESDIAIARAALATLLQRPATEPIEIDGEIPDVGAAEPVLSDAIARGLDARGVVRIAARAADSAKVQLETTRASRLPHVDSFASWGASRGDPDRAVGVIAGIDLFDRGRAARLAQARAGIEQARAEETSARDRVTMEIVTAWNRAHAARERIALATQSVASAETAARIVRDRYEHGLTTITEHLRAQNALVTAQHELLAARYAAVIGDAELRRSMGDLR